MTEIVNRVKESGLISIDLADYKSTKELVSVDIADVLWQGLVLKEKMFRTWVKEHDWSAYADKAVYVICSVDAIIPTWAFMLIGSNLQHSGAFYVIGSKVDLEKSLIKTRISEDNLEDYRDGRVIIKGCADISSPEYAMSELVRYIQPVAKSIMYGEPCSTVPVFKRK
ncbi:MAG: DUF2480 family protein [Crocinitomicaceae bacterium]|nr:DUF2480 family protein [Crocinitomicaceae bacterium]MDG1775910.1 DUF2480 family protein [Crocinitomicaceae bacterium]